MKNIKIAILAFGAAVMLSACGSKTPAAPANEGDAIKAKARGVYAGVGAMLEANI